MTLKGIEWKAQQLLVRCWDEVKAVLEAMSVPSPRPSSDGYEIFNVSYDDDAPHALRVEIPGVVLQLPERYSATASNLFVHIRALIELDAAALRSKRLQTSAFSTEVAYFRYSRAELKHVFGAHYDSEFAAVAHPVFHGQLKCYNERGAVVSELYSLGCESKSAIAGVLGNARVPTSQLDFFSVIVQLCADHLIDANADDTRRELFNRLRALRRQLQGCGYAWPGFQQASSCMQAAYWYEDVPPLAAASYSISTSIGE